MVPLCIIAIALAILISCNTILSSRGACIVILFTIVMVIVITIVMVIVIAIVMVMVIKIGHGHGHHFVTKNHCTKDARRV